MNMKSLVAFGFVGICVAICGAQDLNKKISIEIPAGPASKVLQSLSQQAGVSLEPSSVLRNEVFVVSAHDVTVQEIMDRLAQAGSGTWIKQSTGYILTREPAMTLAQERAEVKRRADLIAAAVAKLTASAGLATKFDQAAAAKLAEQTRRTLERADTGGGVRSRIASGTPDTANQTPTSRALARLLSAIDPTQLARIGLNQRVVFSTRPTPMQIGLGNQGMNAFRTFVTEQALYADAYKANDNQPGRVIFINGFGTPTMGNGDPKLGLGVGLVIVQRRFGSMLEVQIIAADPNLDTIASGSQMLQIDQSTRAASTQPGEPLKISAEAQEMAKALGGGAGTRGGARRVAVTAFAISTGSPGSGNLLIQSTGGGSSTPKLSAELRNKILHPEQYEPLAFVPGEAMLALARQSTKNLVALLPDNCFDSMTRMFANDVSASELISSLPVQHGLSLAEDGGWLVVKPVAPAEARINVVNRNALGTLLRSMDRSGLLRLDDLTTFAVAQNKAPSFSDMDTDYVRLINTSAAERDFLSMSMGQYTLYRFYGSLAPGQRESFQSGGQLPLVNMTPAQIGLISDMVFNSPGGPNVRLPRNGGNDTSLTFSIASAGGGRGLPIYLPGNLSAATERTIVLPNGITRDGYLTGGITQKDVVQAIDSQTSDSTIMDGSALAFERLSMEDPQMASFANSQVRHDQFRMARQSDITLQFQFTPAISMNRDLTDAWVDGNRPAGAYSSLPADFRNKVEQTQKELSQAFSKGGAGRQANPPPMP